MPQLDISTFPAQLAWLFITFSLLYLIIWKIALPRILEVRDTRQQRIEDDLEKAEILRKEAADVLAALDKSHTEATEKAQTIYKNSEQSAAEARAKLQEETANRFLQEILTAENRIAKEFDLARETIPIVASDITRAAVNRLIGSKISKDQAEVSIGEALKRGN